MSLVGTDIDDISVFLFIVIINSTYFWIDPLPSFSHERDERNTSMADTIHPQPEISPQASVVYREITLKGATTFDFMGTLN